MDKNKICRHENKKYITPATILALAALSLPMMGASQPVSAAKKIDLMTTSKSKQALTSVIVNQKLPVLTDDKTGIPVAPTSIFDDTYLKKQGIDISDLNANSVLKLTSLFHIFANQASLSADTNGNLAVKVLDNSNDFGTRSDSYNLTSGDIYYIQQLAQNIQSNAFRNKTFNHVVLGDEVNVSIDTNKLLLNGLTTTNLKPEDVSQDTACQTYIDFGEAFHK